MKRFIVTAVSALIYSSSLALAEDVVTLTQANFDETINNNQFVLAEFYAPWCGHCKKLAPEYEKAATALKNYDPKVVIAKIDATEEADLASKYGVRGFPTLKWFVNGEVTDYSGGRDEQTIVSWIQKKTGPPAKSITTAAAVEEFKKSGDAVVVGVFKTDDEAAAFLKHAQTDDETPYGICVASKESCDAVVKALGAAAAPAVVVLQNFDEGKAVYTGDVTSAKDLSTFVSGNLLPLVVPFSQKVAPKIFGGNVKNHLLIFVDGEPKDILSEMKKVAATRKGEVLFVTVQKTDSRLVEYFGVKEEEMPTVRMVSMGDAGVKKYKYTGSKLVEKEVSQFVADYFAGKLTLDLKSEEPVPESEQGPVRVLVGKDFEQVVSAPGKDVLVEFYAPWCGHCKKLAPEYDAVGEHFKDNENIIIAKMDSTANEVERVSISGFPTLKFFPADSDEIVDYDGARDKEGIIKFIEENAKSLKK